MGKVADQYLVVDPWQIAEDGFHADRSRPSESLFSLANEHMGVRGYFDEGYSGDSLVGCYLNGINEEHFLAEPTTYKGISNRICFTVNTVDWLYARLALDGENLDLATSRISGFRRCLDFRTGELRREFIWQTASGKETAVAFGRFLSMRTKELAFQRISLRPLNYSGSVAVTLGLDFSPVHESYKKNFWNCPRKSADEGRCAILGITKNIGHNLYAGFKVLSPNGVAATYVESAKFVGVKFNLPVTQGETANVDKLAVLATTRNPLDSADAVWALGESTLAANAGETYDAAFAANAEHWRDFWAKSDITIEGDDETQQGIRYCLFQLEQTYRGVVPGSNIGAKGLSGEAYNGNAFWDSETYCLPFYMFSNPPAARSLLDFRYRTLPQAEDRARDLDCQGACFPIATCDGTESCTLWQHASLQFQPTTAVAYGIKHYVHVTGDAQFLYREGAEILVEICRFLATRGQWSPRRHKFGYYAVMGPDEFQMMVNNNCYTNYMAQRSFQYALAALAYTRAQVPDQYAALVARTSLAESELADWKAMADDMFIPYDPETLLFEEHEGFFELPHIDIDAIPVADFPLYHHWSYDRIYRNDMIKQPDVLMFMLLYNSSFTLAQKRANYEYYEPRCIHESSLSPSVHSILASELGRYDEAFDFFRFATRIDLDDYNRNVREGIHMTSIAAAWMTIVYGFGGMRSDGDELVFNPTIPDRWNSYSFRLVYRGSVIRVTVHKDAAVLQVLSGEPVAAVVNGEPSQITAQGLRVPVNVSAVSSPRPRSVASRAEAVL
jgi:maltose phosphorylase